MQPTLFTQNAKVGDSFVDEMWEPILGTLGATFEVTAINQYANTEEDTYYDIQFVAGDRVATACNGEARGRKL